MSLFEGSKNNRSRVKNCENHDAVEKRTPYVFQGLKVKKAERKRKKSNLFYKENEILDSVKLSVNYVRHI